MRMPKAPDHPALRNKLLFSRRRRLFSYVIGQEVTSVLLAHRCIIPIRHDLLRELTLEFTSALSTVGCDEEQRPEQRQGETSKPERLLITEVRVFGYSRVEFHWRPCSGSRYFAHGKC